MNVSVKSAMRIMIMSTLVVLLLLVVSSNVKAVANPYKGTNASSSTHAAWQYVYDNTGVILPNWGDDYNWWLSAKNAGFDTGTAAKAGSVAVYKSTKNNSKWDQVAYVTSVNGSKMNIKEGEFYNNGKWGEHTDTVDAKVGSLRFKGESYEAKLVGFIHVYEAQRIEVKDLVSDTIPEGDYIIHSSANDNLVVTIDEGIKNKSNVALRTNKRNETTQVLSIKRNGNGYNITERKGTYALEVPASNKKRGANVHIWNLPNNPNRPCAKWVFKKDGGFYNIFAINSGLAMEIYTGKAADGKNIVMWAYYNHTSERWRLEPYAVDIGKLTINDVVNKEYTGQTITQNPTIQINGQTLKQGTDYELSYRNNVNPGTATVVIKGKGAFYGATERNFVITKKPNSPSGNGGQNGTPQRDDTKDEKMITTQTSDKDFKGAVFRKLRARETKTTKNSITLKWVKIKNASKYVIYGNKCGVKNKMKKLVTLKGGKTSWTHKKLAKGTYYKYTVVAYRGSGNNTKTITISNTVHAATKGSKKTNCKAIAKVPGKVQLIMGRSFTLKPSQTKEVKSGKIHKHRAVGYESANTKICTVNKKGKITAKKKGKCNIFVYAQNGTYKICKINVINKPSVKETAAKKIAAKKPGKVVITKCKPSKNNVALKWKKVKNAKKYILQVYIGGKWKNVCTTKKLGWTFKGKYKTKYKFRVCGLNGKIKGTYSDIKTCKTYYKASVIRLNLYNYYYYDVTGDGKNDEIFLDKDYDYDGVFESVYIYINGKKAYSCSCYNPSDYIYLITLGNQKRFFKSNIYNNDGTQVEGAILRYTKGKLKKIVDSRKVLGEKYGYKPTMQIGTKVSDNTITTNMGYGLGFSHTVGSASFEFKYKYSKGTLKMAKYTGKVLFDRTYSSGRNKKASRSVKAYKKPNTKSKYFKIKKGGKVKILSYYYKGSKRFFKVKCGKKTGYVKWVKYNNGTYDGILFQ